MIAALLSLALVATARADEAADLLAKFDAVMSPAFFEAKFTMTAHREDGTDRSYDLRVWKAGADRLRATFDAPSSARGQEILRAGENLWIYMPSLRKAIRLASRESFMGGDFNNADVLRVNYAADYAATVAEKAEGRWTLELKARSPSVAYDRVRLVLTPAGLPLTAEFYASSGKMLRSASYSEPTDFGGHTRPARIRMENRLTPARWSEMVTSGFKIVPSIPDARFAVTSLGR